MSVLRPVTFLACRAFTSTTSIPFDSKIWQIGIQYTPVDSMATVSMSQWFNQSASSCRSAVKVQTFEPAPDPDYPHPPRSHRRQHQYPPPLNGFAVISHRTDVFSHCCSWTPPPFLRFGFGPGAWF